MRRLAASSLIFLSCLAGGAWLQAFDIPFIFLEGPSGRSNPHDPKNPNRPTATQVPLLVNSYTHTPSFTRSPTASITATTSETSTASPSPSASPTATDSATETPYAGTPTSTETPSPTFSATPTSTATPTASPSPTPSATSTASSAKIFEDFDSSSVLKNVGTYNDGASTITGTVSTAEAASGTSSMYVVVSTAAVWGCGINFESNYAPGGTTPTGSTLDMTGTITFKFKVKTDQPINFTARFREKGPGDENLENENWITNNIVLAASASWQQVEVSIAPMGEDTYGNNPLCAGTCANAGMGDNLKQLDQVFSVQFQFGNGIATPANVYIDDILFDSLPAGSPTNTPTFSVTQTFSASPTASPFAGSPTSTPTPVILTGTKFEDFETGTPLNPGPYGAGPIPSSSWSLADYVSPIYGWRLDTSSTGWGAGINIESNYGVVNATGRDTLAYWIKSSQTITYTVRFSEAQAGIENENWRSPDQTVTGGAGWTFVTIPLASFAEDDYGDPACAGTCSAQGNNTMELAAVDKFEIQFAAGLTGAVIYLDDIWFTNGPACNSCVPSASFGYNTVGAFQNTAAGILESARWNFAGGTIMSLSIYVTYLGDDPGLHHVTMGIYADSAGTPTGRLATTASEGVTTTGWVTLPLTAPACLAAGNYYLAFHREQLALDGFNGLRVAYDTGALSISPQTNAVPYGMPATYPAPWGWDVNYWSVIANYCP